MNVNVPEHAGFAVPGLKGRKVKAHEETSLYSQRFPFLNFLPSGARNHFIAMAGEFVGTFLFLFFAFSGTQVANSVGPTTATDTGSDTSRLLYISLVFGFSLAVNAWVFFRISGGLFNPAVTLGMCLVGAVPWVRGALVVVSQLLGAISAAAVVLVLFPGGANIRTTLGGGTSVVQGLFIEMFLTAQLVFTIFMLAAEKHKATFIAPIGIGLSLFIGELSGVYFTGGSLNPARSFGPCVAVTNFEYYHWIYWVGPILGSLLASGFYKFIKVIEYETANPGQDLDDREAEVFNPEKDIHRPNVSVAPDYIINTSGTLERVSSIGTGSRGLESRGTGMISPIVPTTLPQTVPSAVTGPETSATDPAPQPQPYVNYFDPPENPMNSYRNAPNAESGHIWADGQR